jgi:serine/threonine protein kinase
MSPDSQPYSRLNDRYQILSLIGKGGMASVYKAHDEFLDRHVAVKLFDAPLGEIAEVSNQEHELQMLARLNHHGLVTLIDAGIVENKSRPLSRMYLVMELITGPTLKKLMAERALSGREIAQIGFDLAESLQYIHANGVIHRDVKPANVLMVAYGENDDRPRAKLADFGIALLTGGVSDPAETIGTAAYLSPEQAMRDAIEPATDVYSLGLCLLQAFTRELAFPGTPLESATARLIRDPAIPESLPPLWVELLTAMTARNPEDRPTSGEAAAALGELIGFERSLEERSSEARSSENGEADAAPAAQPAQIASPPETFDRIARVASRLLNAAIVVIATENADGTPQVLSCHGIDASWIDPTAVLADPSDGVGPLVPGAEALGRVSGTVSRADDGHVVSTVWVLDQEPLATSAYDDQNLDDVAALAMREIELARPAVAVRPADPERAEHVALRV